MISLDRSGNFGRFGHVHIVKDQRNPFISINLRYVTIFQ